jgi:hypothetical protein
MANANRPSGFTPVQYLNGAAWNGQARIYSIAASYGTALYIGDPVISAGTSDANGLQGVALAAATGAVRGVIIGLSKYYGMVGNPSNLDITYRPASDPSAWYALVVDDPNVIFEIQEESNGTQLAAVDIGMNTIPVIGSGSGNLSGWLLRSATGATPATTATLQLRLMGLAQKPAGTNVFGAYAKHLVKFNVHELGTGTGAAGV